jgi:hypothetical protein
VKDVAIKDAGPSNCDYETAPALSATLEMLQLVSGVARERHEGESFFVSCETKKWNWWEKCEVLLGRVRTLYQNRER